MSSIGASNLFAVKGLVAVITGGGTGVFHHYVDIVCLASDWTSQASAS